MYCAWVRSTGPSHVSASLGRWVWGWGQSPGWVQALIVGHTHKTEPTSTQEREVGAIWLWKHSAGNFLARRVVSFLEPPCNGMAWIGMQHACSFLLLPCFGHPCRNPCLARRTGALMSRTKGWNPLLMHILTAYPRVGLMLHRTHQ